MKRKYNIDYSDDWERVVVNSAEFNKSMEIIVDALKERCYDPYTRIYGHLQENSVEDGKHMVEIGVDLITTDILECLA